VDADERLRLDFDQTTRLSTPSASPALGFVGLGSMGSRIARRLLEAGHAVHGWNRTATKAEELEEAGLVVESSAADVARAADVVFSMVTDTAAVETVVEGEDGLLVGMRPGGILVEMSTVDPAVSAGLAERFAAGGAFMLDAPVSGSIATLEAGQLSIMVGGDEGAYERVRPLLLDIGPKVMRIGDNGQALLVKLAVNNTLVAEMVAFCENVAMAEKGGVKREIAVEALLQSVVSSPMLQYRGPFVLEGRMPAEAWSNVNLQQKDMTLGLATGKRLATPLPTSTAANELLTAARGMGLERYDFAVVYEVFRVLNGLAGARGVGE
jgi:3-hydroxyisobutyrate dehydrogenase-like beta-hydroxyacid dehydrogenase